MSRSRYTKVVHRTERIRSEYDGTDATTTIAARVSDQTKERRRVRREQTRRRRAANVAAGVKGRS